MIKVSFSVKKKKKKESKSLYFEKKEDFLFAIDKFLKTNKISLSDLDKFKVDCQDFDKSVSCRVVKIIAKGVELANKLK